MLSFEKLTEILIFRPNGKATLSEFHLCGYSRVKEGILAWIFMQLLPFALAEKLSSSDGKIKKGNEKEIRLANI